MKFREIEQEYGVTDDLIAWMRDNDLYSTDWIIGPDNEDEDYEFFIVTDEIVAKFHEEKRKLRLRHGISNLSGK